MLKFDENDRTIEVRGKYSSVTWVNRDHVCRTKQEFQQVLEENKSRYAFLCGTQELRYDDEICLFAAKNGVDVETFYDYGNINDEIVYAAISSSILNISQVSFQDQLKFLIERYPISKELFGKIMEIAPENSHICSAVFGSILEQNHPNNSIRKLIKKDKDCLMFCMKKDKNFYEYACDYLKNEKDVIELYEYLKLAEQNLNESEQKDDVCR